MKVLVVGGIGVLRQSPSGVRQVKPGRGGSKVGRI